MEVLETFLHQIYAEGSGVEIKNIIWASFFNFKHISL